MQTLHSARKLCGTPLNSLDGLNSKVPSLLSLPSPDIAMVLLQMLTTGRNGTNGSSCSRHVAFLNRADVEFSVSTFREATCSVFCNRRRPLPKALCLWNMPFWKRLKNPEISKSFAIPFISICTMHMRTIAHGTLTNWRRENKKSG